MEKNKQNQLFKKSNAFEMHILHVLHDPDYREDYLRRIKKTERLVDKLYPKKEQPDIQVVDYDEDEDEKEVEDAVEEDPPWLHVCHDQDYAKDFKNKNQASFDMIDGDKYAVSQNLQYCYLVPSIWKQGQGVNPLTIWEGFKESTTAHGLPRFNSSSGFKKFFWGGGLFIVLALLMYNFSMITIYFFDYPTDVTVKIQHEMELIFPAVTICNMNPVKKSMMAGSDLFSSSGSQQNKRRKKRAVSCGLGWHEYDGRCYFASSELRDHTAADLDCVLNGSRLVGIQDQLEENFVDSITNAQNGSEYWLGLHEDPASAWYWVDGTSFSYSSWAGDGQDNGGRCGALVDPKVWRSKPCDDRYRYVCETKSGGSTTSTDPYNVDYTFMEELYCLPDTTTQEASTVIAETSSKSATTELPETSSQCCCTCCVNSLYAVNYCNTCGSKDIHEAAVCAANVTDHTLSTTPSTPVSSTTQSTTTIVPPSIPGSTYPERIQTREEFQNIEKLTEILANIEEPTKVELGYKAEDMILDCQYAGYTCTLKEFAHYYNPIHGNCFIFNSGWNGTSNFTRTSSKTGRRYGLHLIVNILQEEYTVEGGDTAGVRLVVHQANRMPFPEDEGITVGPGHVTSIGMRQVEITRVGPPHGKCINHSRDAYDRTVYEEFYPVEYSNLACGKTCYQRHVIETCGCGDPYIPLNGQALSDTVVRACNSSNITEDDCRYGVQRKYQHNKLPCDCKDPCTDVAYSLEVSIGMWPSGVNKDVTLEKLADKIGTSFDINDPKAYKSNLLKLEISFEEFNFEKITEKPGYTPISYINDIGGSLGLCIGFSILTIAEFIEIGMDLTVYLGSLIATKIRRKEEK